MNGGRPRTGCDCHARPAVTCGGKQSTAALVLALGDRGRVEVLGKRSRVELHEPYLVPLLPVAHQPLWRDAEKAHLAVPDDGCLASDGGKMQDRRVELGRCENWTRPSEQSLRALRAGAARG